MEPHSHVGPYEILEPLGAGGMGEVYRARDTRLDRDVAIKVLPADVAGSADRLARLPREARLLAQLSHQHVAQVHGVEEHDGTFFVVMELAPGETLDERMRGRGALPLAEVLPIAEQLCRGLAAAHAQGIVHRDLKPSNITVAEDASGRLSVKILDFGLAKAFSNSEDTTGLTSSPTELAATRDGVIQGTAPYMSPEQARGKAADQRTDVWAFGTVLYEMLAGRRAFDGATVSDVIAAILQREADLGALRHDVPPEMHRVLRRCLAKGPDDRLRDMADVRLAIADSLEAPFAAAGPAVAGEGRSFGVGLALAGMVVAALAGAWGARAWSPEPQKPVTRLAIPLPKGHLLTSPPAISADGRTIAYATSATPSGSTQVYVRRLEEGEARLVPGSDNGEYPQLSSDGTEVVFNRNGALWKAATAGGAPSELMASPTGFGSVWISPSEMLVAPALDRLVRVSTTDGTFAPATEVDRLAGEYAHTWPQVLAGGRMALFRVWGVGEVNGTALLDLESGERRLIAPHRYGFYTGNGALAVIDNTSNTLRAARLDLTGTDTLSGEIPVLEGFYWGVGDNREWLSFSETGTLVYARGDPADRRFVWTDGRGNEELIDPARRVNIDPKLSFDGTKIVFREHSDVWLKDLTTGAEEIIVSSDRGRVTNFAPLFSADDREVVFASNRSGDWEIYAKPIDGTGAARPILERAGFQSPQSVGPDGSVVFVEIGADTADDLWILPPDGDPRPLVVTTTIETQGRLSHDGALLAYAGTRSGKSEIYVVGPGGGQSVRVSRDGGFDPSWSPDNRTLFFRSNDGVMRTTVRTGPPIAADEPELFLRTGNIATDFGRSFDVGADGRLLMIRPQPGSMPDQLNVVINWFAELDSLLPPR